MLLSVVDHFKRVDDEDEEEEEEEEEEEDQRRKTSRRRVARIRDERSIGRHVLLCGAFRRGPADASIWFLDHAYAEQMYDVPIHAKEKVVGWYSTGPKIRENDLDIGELFEKYCADPVLVIVNLSPTADDKYTLLQTLRLDVKEDGTMTQKEQNVRTRFVYD